jgi:Tfp pilus assembly protein PilF
MGESRLALQEVDAALKIQPDASEAHNQRGMLLGGLGNLAAAAGAFERAATLDPKNALMWFNLGLTRLRSGDNAGAAAALRRALDLRPDFTDAKKLLAETGR